MEDPRSNLRNQVRYQLDEILFLVISAVVSGANDWDEIALFGQAKVDWLRKFFAYEAGTPCDTTLSRLFAKIDPISFNQYFSEWINTLHQVTDGKLVAFDGKTMRGSYTDSDKKSALHIVSAFACDQQLCLGQLTVDQKSNEITAIPEMLDLLTLEGCIVTIDAMGCQKAIARKIRKADADYILQVKNNQKTTLEQVEKVFGLTQVNDLHTTHSLGHGRIEQRTCEVIEDLTHLDDCEEWKDLTTLIRIRSVRTHKQTGQEEKSTRYYITSRSDSAENFNRYIRSHWAIENKLHWALDVTFNEDKSRKRVGNSAANFNIISKMAMTMINKTDARKSPSKILSKKNKRNKAAYSDKFREQILKNAF